MILCDPERVDHVRGLQPLTRGNTPHCAILGCVCSHARIRTHAHTPPQVRCRPRGHGRCLGHGPLRATRGARRCQHHSGRRHRRRQPAQVLAIMDAEPGLGQHGWPVRVCDCAQVLKAGSPQGIGYAYLLIFCCFVCRVAFSLWSTSGSCFGARQRWVCVCVRTRVRCGYWPVPALAEPHTLCCAQPPGFRQRQRQERQIREEKEKEEGDRHGPHGADHACGPRDGAMGAVQGLGPQQPSHRPQAGCRGRVHSHLDDGA